MKKGFVFLIFLTESAFASPTFEGLTWMANVGAGVAIINFILGLAVMQFFLKTKKRSIVKSVWFGIVQLILTIVSIPIAWIGTSWLVYGIKPLESFVNVLFVIGLFILPAIRSIYLVKNSRKSAL